VEQSGGIQASLAGRYATALFELARAEKQLDAVGTSLAALSRALAESADLRELTTSPLTSRDNEPPFAALAGRHTRWSLRLEGTRSVSPRCGHCAQAMAPEVVGSAGGRSETATSAPAPGQLGRGVTAFAGEAIRLVLGLAGGY
jgi:hypothetical protein